MVVVHAIPESYQQISRSIARDEHACNDDNGASSGKAGRCAQKIRCERTYRNCHSYFSSGRAAFNWLKHAILEITIIVTKDSSRSECALALFARDSVGEELPLLRFISSAGPPRQTPSATVRQERHT